MVSFAEKSEPNEPPIRGFYCANCGAMFIAARESLPEICTACNDLTTWRTTKPRSRIPWVDTHGVVEMNERPVAGVRVYDVGWLAKVGNENSTSRNHAGQNQEDD